MQEDKAQTDLVSKLLVHLADAMRRSNQALVAFDGTGCARYAQEELRICAAIERFRCSWPELSAEVFPAEFEELYRMRRSLLRSSQRTVNALWGVAIVSRPTYEPAQLRTY